QRVGDDHELPRVAYREEVDVGLELRHVVESGSTLRAVQEEDATLSLEGLCDPGDEGRLSGAVAAVDEPEEILLDVLVLDVGHATEDLCERCDFSHVSPPSGSGSGSCHRR